MHITTHVHKIGLQYARCEIFAKSALMPDFCFCVQINGGTISDKVDFAYKLFEKSVPIDSVFKQNEMIDAISITKGCGTEGVVTRWGVTRLPRKTHRGLRKVMKQFCQVAPLDIKELLLSISTCALKQLSFNMFCTSCEKYSTPVRYKFLILLQTGKLVLLYHQISTK